MTFEIGFTDLGRSSLKVLEKKAQREIMKAVESLAKDHNMGKPLMGPLTGLRSLRVRDRYRVVYRINVEAQRVYVELAGERRPGQDSDIYRVACKLLDTLKD